LAEEAEIYHAKQIGTQQITEIDLINGELIGKEGQLTLNSPDLGENCSVRLYPTGSVSGRLAVSCDNGRSISGDYSRSGNGVFRGSGKSGQGVDYTFRLETAQGKGNPGAGHFE
jgi:hypothetical protein